MALPLILRSVAKPEGMKNLFRLSSIITNKTACYTQFSGEAQKGASLVEKCANLSAIKPNIQYRNISLTTPLKSSHADHRIIWNIEKGISVVLLGLVPITFIVPNMVCDNLLAVIVMPHIFWGLESCIVDYLRPIVIGHTLNKLSMVALYIVCFLTLGGLLYFNYNDIGIGKFGQKIWAIKPAQ